MDATYFGEGLGNALLAWRSVTAIAPFHILLGLIIVVPITAALVQFVLSRVK